MWISEFDNYKKFIKAKMKTLPMQGRGSARQLALYLNVQPMIVSHILSRERHFTIDQAGQVAEFFALDHLSTEYFIYLVSFERSDSEKMRLFYKTKLVELKTESEKIKNLIVGQEELSEADQGKFYSNWYYCGVWLLSAIKEYQTADKIASYFGLERRKVGEIVSFLLETGMCIEDRGLIKPGKRSIHVGDGKVFVNNHRRNWREKAIQKFTAPGDKDLFYSSPVTISKKDAEVFRKQLLDLIKDFSQQVQPSAEEEIMCLNLDWFRVV